MRLPRTEVQIERSLRKILAWNTPGQRDSGWTFRQSANEDCWEQGTGRSALQGSRAATATLLDAGDWKRNSGTKVTAEGAGPKQDADVLRKDSGIADGS